MSRHPGISRLIEAGGNRSTRQDIADRIASKSTVVQDAQEALVDNAIVPDTRATPSPPANVLVRPRNRGMDVEWDAPPAADHVATTDVMLVRTSDNHTQVRKFASSLLRGSISGMEPTEYQVSAQHRNKFGAVSGFTTPVVRITPTPTVAEQIAADIQIAAAQIAGQLGEAQVPQITSPAKLAEAVYEAAADAAGKGANLLPYLNSTWEPWDEGPWPQAGIANTVGLGRTARVVRGGPGKVEMEVVVDPAGPAGVPSVFFPGWDRRGTVAGDTYIYSAVVRNLGGNPVQPTARVLVQVASDAAGTGLETIGVADSPVVAIAGNAMDHRVYVKFTVPAAKPFIRFAHYTNEAGVTLYWRDFQLERALPGQTKPGRWTLPTISVGALSAKLIAAWDLTAVRAIVGNLTVESAKVVSLAAEKFVGGTITGQEFVLAAGGRFRTANNGTRIDDGGITLLHGADFNTSAYRLDQKITSLADRAAYAFYHDTTTGFRGPIVRSDGGNTDTTRGAVILHATYSGSLIANSSARLELLAVSGGGVVNAYGTFAARGNVQLFNTTLRQLDSANGVKEIPVTSIAASATLTHTHNLGTIPFMVLIQWSDASATWRPLVDQVSSWRIAATATDVTITNLATSPASRPVRGVILK